MSEILAPAGGENSAFAAINAGADAIYLGLDKFSARSSAENFNRENFIKICKYARAFGVKVYVALNTVVKDRELTGFFNSVEEAWNNGADALILQDLFLGKFLKQRFPQLKLHLSTQAGTCNSLGAQLAKESGFDRVILARETKLSDIAEIAKIIETEVFVQGALCTCFSGQCYMSSFAGGNSGNRGKCKQPCRKLYGIDRAGFEEKAYRLSLSDLSVGEKIEDYIAAGVTSFKIEGRMRRPEYVAAAVSYYRRILDGTPIQNSLSDLKRTYNRGNYTKGLAFGQDKSLISSAVQGHIGEFAGIIKVENSKYICQSRLKFNKGDGFKVLRDGKEVGGGLFGNEVKGGFTVNTRDRLKNGDKVFITTDTALNESLRTKKAFIHVKIQATLISGQPASALIDGTEIIGGQIPEPARTRPLTEEEIIRCFDKTDGFPFKPQTEVLTDGVFIAASALNAFRRKVYTEYFEKISSSHNARLNLDIEVPDIAVTPNNKTAIISTDLNGKEADVGILKIKCFSDDVSKRVQNFKGEKFLFVPPYLNGEEIQKISEIADYFDGLYCDNYFGYVLAKQLNKYFFAGSGFNFTNTVSLVNCDARYICLSKELTVAEANLLSTSNTFTLSSGNIKVMDLLYCPFEKKCSTCDKREHYMLTDGDGRKFPLRRYNFTDCRFEVFNCADLKTDGGITGKLTDCTLNNENKNFTRGHSVTGIN